MVAISSKDTAELPPDTPDGGGGGGGLSLPPLAPSASPLARFRAGITAVTTANRIERLRGDAPSASTNPLYSDETLQQRAALVRHPAVQRELDILWGVAVAPRRQLHKAEYLTMHRKMVLALQPNTAPREAEQLAESDWARDAEGEPYLDGCYQKLFGYAAPETQQLLQGERRRYAALVPLQHLGKQDALERFRARSREYNQDKLAAGKKEIPPATYNVLFSAIILLTLKDAAQSETVTAWVASGAPLEAAPIGAIGAVRARVRYQGLVPRTGLHRGRTQHMSLSAPDVQTRCNGSTPVPYSIGLIMACAPIHHRRTVEVDWK